MSGRVVVVTGATAGIGRACVRAFAARGDSVALLARGEAGLAGANHAEEVPHLLQPGWHDLMPLTSLAEGKPSRATLGEVPLLVVRDGDRVHVLADRCAHLSGPLSAGELADGCVTCPWHGSTFRLTDGSVARGPATAPQPAFETRIRGGLVQACLPGAG